MLTIMLSLLLAPAARAGDLPITRLTSVSFQVADVDKARGFYTRILGFDEAFDLQDAQGRGTSAVFKVNDDQFIQFSPGLPDPAGFLMTRISLLTPDLGAMAKALQARGLTPSAISKGADGNRHLQIKDPDGFEIDFVQFDPGSEQVKRRGKAAGAGLFDHLMHAGLAADAEKQAMAFYGDKLGFREFQRGGPAPNEIRWINMMMPGTHQDYLELMIMNSAARADRQHIAFDVPDIQRTHQQLVQRGLPPRPRPFAALIHRWILNVRDPFGIRVEVLGEATKP